VPEGVNADALHPAGFVDRDKLHCVAFEGELGGTE
jgi:hypothetical protein